MFDALVMLVGWLDSLPNVGRLVLGAALLALLLGLMERRIRPENVALGVSYRKSALLALLIVPVLIHTVFGVRVVVLVEELPALVRLPGYLAWMLFAVWLGGVGYAGRRALLRRLTGESDPGATEYEVDDKLSRRFTHWCNRLNLPAGVRLVVGGVRAPRIMGMREPLIVLPRAVVHWPVAAQDLLITREVCQVKRRMGVWSLIGEAVAVLYWPIASVRAIALGLDRSLEQSCNRLAMSCFNDRLGYERASKQLEQRMEPVAGKQLLPEWEDEDISLGMRFKYRQKSQRRDPQYDRVFWSLVQATVVVFILTGVTLRQLEDFDAEQADLAERWFFSYERSADYSDKEIESTRPRR